MKILFTNFHPRNGGGHVTYIVNLLRGLVGAHQLTVATPGSSRLYRLASHARRQGYRYGVHHTAVFLAG